MIKGGASEKKNDKGHPTIKYCLKQVFNPNNASMDKQTLR